MSQSQNFFNFSNYHKMQHCGMQRQMAEKGKCSVFHSHIFQKQKVTRRHSWFPTYFEYGFRMEMRSSSSFMNSIKFFVFALDSMALVSCVASMSDMRKCLAKICQLTVPALFRSSNEPCFRLIFFHVSKAKEFFDVSDQLFYFFRVTFLRLVISIQFQQKRS